MFQTHWKTQDDKRRSGIKQRQEKKEKEQKKSNYLGQYHYTR